MIKRNALLFGNKTKSVIQFLALIGLGKRALYAHPDFVAMDWKSFEELKKKKHQFVFDEMVELDDEYKYIDELKNPNTSGGKKI